MTAKAKANVKKLAVLGVVTGFKFLFQQASGVGYAKAVIRGDQSSDAMMAGFDALAGKKQKAIRLD